MAENMHIDFTTTTEGYVVPSGRFAAFFNNKEPEHLAYRKNVDELQRNTRAAWFSASSCFSGAPLVLLLLAIPVIPKILAFVAFGAVIFGGYNALVRAGHSSKLLEDTHNKEKARITLQIQQKAPKITPCNEAASIPAPPIQELAPKRRVSPLKIWRNTPQP